MTPQFAAHSSSPRVRPTRPVRALFVIPSLRTGGAERVFTTLLNEFACSDMDLHLAVLQREGQFFDELSTKVQVHNLSVRRSIHSFLPLLNLVRRLRPDVVFATTLRLNLVVTLLKPLMPAGTRIVIREIKAHDELLGVGVRASSIQTLARFAFRGAHAIVCQSQSLKADLQRTCRSELAHAHAIPNPVDIDAIAARSRHENPFAGQGPGPHVVAVGALERKKGVDRLIDAFPSLLHKRPHAILWLVGDGREAPRLAAQADALGIRDRVRFVGKQRNPYPWMRSADVFVLASRVEGMPNVLLEALACECPVVVLDHPGGTRDVMRETGQEWRVVRDLTAWDDSWFERPPPDVLQAVRNVFERRIVVDQYRRVLIGADAISDAA